MKAFGPMMSLLALAACQPASDQRGQKPVDDGGTSEAGYTGEKLLPKGVVVNGEGRWSLTSAPPFSQDQLSKPEIAGGMV